MIYYFNNNTRFDEVYDQLNEKGPITFIHESMVQNEQKSFLDICKNENIVFHYFPEIINNQSLEQIINTRLISYILGIHIAKKLKVNKSRKFDKFIHFLIYFFSVEFTSFKFYYPESIKLSSNYFNDRSLSISEIKNICQKLNINKPIYELIENWQLNKNQAIINPSKVKSKYYILHCDTESEFIQIKDLLIKKNARGVIICREKVDTQLFDRIKVFHNQKKSMLFLFELLGLINDKTADVVVCFYWDKALFETIEQSKNNETIIVKKYDDHINSSIRSFLQKIEIDLSINIEILNCINLFSFRLTLESLNLTNLNSFLVDVFKHYRGNSIDYLNKINYDDISFLMGNLAILLKGSYFETFLNENLTFSDYKENDQEINLNNLDLIKLQGIYQKLYLFQQQFLSIMHK